MPTQPPISHAVAAYLADFFGNMLESTDNALNVYLTNGGGGGTSATDEAEFTSGVSTGVPLMAYDTTSGELLILETVPGTRILKIGGSIATSPVYSSAISVQQQFAVGAVTPVKILSANTSRTRFIIKQDGTTDIYVLYGAADPSTALYTDGLPAGGTAHDNSAAKIDDNQWQGEVYVLSSASGGSIMVTEFE